ncbi:hypothetical protein SCLCIDRAFT_1208497 [Scleroderma citrinum Foug A]|uniref:Uncharacterized protein n=1 Tax=Scleroderma citrinum Foug A TaxID=1036808 RepID=A0A0C3EMF9_9AGAM|nr:hypothetical protein SCLCIDRAFT_1208497 [Scleroderma citrinum Foug A]
MEHNGYKPSVSEFTAARFRSPKTGWPQEAASQKPPFLMLLFMPSVIHESELEEEKVATFTYRCLPSCAYAPSYATKLV